MNDNATLSLVAGDLRAVFWPSSGMLGVSLQYCGEELLRRIDDLDAVRRKGSTAGIPLLYPWANRLASLHYRAAGRDVELDCASPLLHFDDRGLPIHGVPWAHLSWKAMKAEPDSFLACLNWDRLDLLGLFPFPHHTQIVGQITSNALTLETIVLADDLSPVPISFGFHPYFGIPHVPRSQWCVQLPARSRLQVDQRGIPTGEQESFGPFEALLGDSSFDDCFALNDAQASFSLSGGGWHITVTFLEGFPYAQVFAPEDKDFIALEPMTAPTNALISGKGLRVLDSGKEFRTSFRIALRSPDN